MTPIAQATRRVLQSLPQGVQLVAVSKFHPVEAIMQAYSAGARAFGESRAQELARKTPLMPADARWHFIGHLQTNKVPLVVGQASLIESVDSERLLAAIDARARALGIVQHVLIELHVAAEETKTGFTPDEAMQLFRSGAPARYSNVCFRGIMGMATNTDDDARVSADFQALAAAKAAISQQCPELQSFDTLSMGMSDDYPLAIAAGANMVRVGTAIFGPREY